MRILSANVGKIGKFSLKIRGKNDVPSAEDDMFADSDNDERTEERTRKKSQHLQCHLPSM